MFPKTSRITPLKLASAGAIAAAALAAAPTALAATSGGAPVTPAVTHAKLSAPFTLGVSDTVVKPGQRITISGLANARAGLNLTIVSNAISSSRSVNGVPAVQTPALVEGIYHTTVRVPPATEPGTEQRPHQPQCAAARGLHDAGTHPHHPHPGLRRGRGRVLPVGDHVGEKPVAALTGLGEGVVAAVVPVEPDGRGADQHL